MTYLIILLAIVIIFYILLQFRFNKLKKDYDEWNLNQESEKEKLKEINLKLDEKNKYITNSIEYARTIQDALFPKPDYVNQYLPDSFYIFKPKEIVSGDFAWFSFQENKIFIAVVDCTGHGVPGAFLSFLGNALLNHIIKEKKVYDTSKILKQLNTEFHLIINQIDRNSEILAGMDVALCCIEVENDNGFVKGKELHYSGSLRPLIMVSKEGTHYKLDEIKPEKYAIGGMNPSEKINFTNHKIVLNGTQSFFIFSDGLTDQFRESDSKKFNKKRFKNLLLKIQELSMDKQKSVIENELSEWQGSCKQTDDILLIGFKI